MSVLQTVNPRIPQLNPRLDPLYFKAERKLQICLLLALSPLSLLFPPHHVWKRRSFENTKSPQYNETVATVFKYSDWNTHCGCQSPLTAASIRLSTSSSRCSCFCKFQPSLTLPGASGLRISHISQWLGDLLRYNLPPHSYPYTEFLPEMPSPQQSLPAFTSQITFLLMAFQC